MKATNNIKMSNTFSFDFMGKNFGPIGNNEALFFIAGPCAIESRAHALEMASALKEIFSDAGFRLIYKSSFDKANRSSSKSFRGVGMEEGLSILEEVRQSFQLPVITDVHLPNQAAVVGEVADILQIPAFLCRQTDLVDACARTHKPLNIKKGQFLAPWNMEGIKEKALEAGNDRIMMCERGTSFGYGNLVVDMRGLEIMKEFAPVIFDATHSVQLPGAKGTCSGGERQYVSILAKAAVAIGIAGLFMEVHQDPDSAPCDGPNMLSLKELPELLKILKKLDQLVKGDDI